MLVIDGDMIVHLHCPGAIAPKITTVARLFGELDFTTSMPSEDAAEVALWLLAEKYDILEYGAKLVKNFDRLDIAEDEEGVVDVENRGEVVSVIDDSHPKTI